MCAEGLRSRALPAIVAVLAWASWSAAAVATPEERFPAVRPATRVQALTVLSGGAPLAVPCLNARIESLHDDPGAASAAARRALSVVLDGVGPLPGELRLGGGDRTLIRYTLDRESFDGIAPDDVDLDGVPDVVEQTLRGLDDAAGLLVDQLGLPSPGPLEVVFADLGGVQGYTLARGRSRERPLVVLDAHGPADARSVHDAAAHQYAHAVTAMLGTLPAGWSEAVATWTVTRLDGGPSPEIARLFAGRIERLPQGLLSDDLDLAAGNALWLAFLDEAYGGPTVRLTIEDLAVADSVATGLTRGLRRSAGVSLEAAFRDFQLWSLLVGERTDGRHFSFARLLPAAPFVSAADGMPELSVQADPPVASLGAADVLIRPGESQGGLTVLFEGEISGRWGADVLAVMRDGSMHRIPMHIQDGRAETTLPLDDLSHAVLLVRNLTIENDRPLRYTWSVHRERGFPFELSSLEAEYNGVSGGVLLSWETTSETHLLGFNVVRTLEETHETVHVNPVWVPAMGDPNSTVSYQYLDSTARPGTSYLYLIEGITLEGLTSRSEPVALVPAASD